MLMILAVFSIFFGYITGIVLKFGGQTTKVLDKGSVEYLGPYGLKKGLLNISYNISKLNTGVITSYALYIVIGLIAYLLFNSYINSSNVILVLVISLSLVLFSNNNYLLSKKNIINNLNINTSVIDFKKIIDMLFVFIFILNTKVLYSIVRANSSDDFVTMTALLFIPVLMTVSFAAISCVMRRKDFSLSIISLIFITLNMIFIFYKITCHLTGLEVDSITMYLKFLLDYVDRLKYLSTTLFAIFFRVGLINCFLQLTCCEKG